MGVWWSRAAMVTPTVVADSQGTLGMSLGWWVLLAWAQATPTCRYRRSPVGDQPPSSEEEAETAESGSNETDPPAEASGSPLGSPGNPAGHA